MFTKSLDSILKTFNKTSEELEVFMDKQQAEITVQKERIEEATRLKGVAETEVIRASRIQRKIKQITR